MAGGGGVQRALAPAARSSVLAVAAAAAYRDGTLLLAELAQQPSLQDIVNAHRKAPNPPRPLRPYPTPPGPSRKAMRGGGRPLRKGGAAASPP
jgi:hypothetical protein